MDQLISYPDLFDTDYVIISDTEMLGINRPTLDVSLRGVMDIEISVQTGSHDVHSGQFGGLAPNPAFILSHLLSLLKNGRDRVLIPEFYSDIVPPHKELDDLRRHAPNVKMFLKKVIFYLGEVSRICRPTRRWYEPTLDITGIDSGYTDMQTVIPGRADPNDPFVLIKSAKIYSILLITAKHVSKSDGLPLEIALPYWAPRGILFTNWWVSV
jgi:acetylornithine deacetylase/succinyl-diaminopimelate desuccinylase-like protein